MSVNYERPQMCKIEGCNRSATHYGCLCYDHWLAAWAAAHEDAIELAPAWDDDTQEVPAFDADCARAWDAAPHVEVLNADGHLMYMAPSRIVTGNGRTR